MILHFYDLWFIHDNNYLWFSFLILHFSAELCYIMIVIHEYIYYIFRLLYNIK